MKDELINIGFMVCENNFVELRKEKYKVMVCCREDSPCFYFEIESGGLDYTSYPYLGIEKLKALIGDKPKSSPAKIVQPERETPGRMARAWNKPIIKAEI